ncbi:hypothetical protein SAMN05660461_1405 [Chitinophaga ginsengisegetis]|uniref:Uncharacterized protein n=1 Tax=Chitinophaga ginsengisegetis TaxID=393003 RepID=A0A1T5NGG7_9BACT|nr:hypothetical protein [Chitinophaga ginsengisegetis]SKC99208.1 hypothetical protein SAMN05660461_1405 [Chitinophaga ginsengisegetis]
MSQKKKNKKETKIEKKTVVDLDNLKSLENIKTNKDSFEEIDGGEINGGRDVDQPSVDPQWPTTTH